MTKKVFLYIMITFYLLAGLNHFFNPSFYLKIIPQWLPNPVTLNYISGAAEILFAVLLMFESTRTLGAWLIIALLVAVFPANIQMCFNYWYDNNPHFWLTVLRLPLQLVLIWWSWKYTR